MRTIPKFRDLDGLGRFDEVDWSAVDRARLWLGIPHFLNVPGTVPAILACPFDFLHEGLKLAQQFRHRH